MMTTIKMITIAVAGESCFCKPIPP
jgi:hypothetical protein